MKYKHQAKVLVTSELVNEDTIIHYLQEKGWICFQHEDTSRKTFQHMVGGQLVQINIPRFYKSASYFEEILAVIFALAEFEGRRIEDMIETLQRLQIAKGGTSNV